MIVLLEKILFKDSNKQGNIGVALLCSVVGIVLNVLLFALKYIIGLFSGSVSIMADAFNNITDAGTSLAMLIGVKIASYGKGKNHPIGHGRFEWVISSLMAFLVMGVGWNLLTGSVGTLGNKEPVNANMLMIFLMVLSVGVKVYMYLYNRKYGRQLDSETMKAVSMDSISDAVATTAVIISVIVSWIFHINVDGYCGILVSLFIIYNGFNSLFETAGRIMGKAPDAEECDEILKLVMMDGFFDRIIELNVEDYGMGRQRAIIKVGYSEECSSSHLQEKIQKVYNRIYEKMGLDSLIVTEQLVNPELTDKLYCGLIELVKSEEPFSYIEDLRIVGGGSNYSLYCDIAIPKSKEKKESEITYKVKEMVAKEDIIRSVYTNFTIFHDVHNKAWRGKRSSDKYDEFLENRMFPRYFKGSLNKHHKILSEMLKDIHGKKVLDVACGSADCVNYLPNDNIYTGVDIAENFRKMALTKLKNYHFNDAKYIRGNACAIEELSHSYDVVLCNLSMQMITPSAPLINEIKRVLKIGGYFIGSVPVSDYGKQRFSYNSDINTSKKLKHFLEHEGLQVDIHEKVNGAICYFKAYYK